MFQRRREGGAGIAAVRPAGIFTRALSECSRGIRGTHVHVSAKHLSKYLGEFEYRWNMRHVPSLMLDRLMHSFVR